MTHLPTGKLTSLSLDEIKKLAREKKKTGAALSGKTITPHAAPGKTHFPMTSTQKSIWMLAQYLDDSQVYNNPYVLACRIEHDMEPARVQQTLNYLMQQHEILRTTFRLVDNDVCQCIADDMSFTTFSFDDISAFNEEDIEKYVSDTAKAKGKIVFDLENGPLVYLHMVKTHRYEYVLFLTFHHIISDGWTVNVFFKMLMENYFRLLQGGTLPIEKTLQFADYALAENRWYAEGEYQTGLAYWTKKLDGITGQLDLAMDYPRPAKMSTAGKIASQFFDASFCQRLQTCAAQHQATQFHVILTAYQLLLHKYSGQQEIIIGAPFANRNLPVTQNMMGLFMNTLPLRFDIDPDASIASLIEGARTECEETMRHQDVPFNYILDEITYVRNPQINPIFQAILTYQVFPHFHSSHGGFKYKPLKVDYGTAKLDLNLWVEEDKDSDGLLFTMNYSSALFSSATIQRMLNDLRTLLETLITQPQLTVRDISLLGDEERSATIAQCHSTVNTPPPAVHSQFEQQAQQKPDAIAVRCEGRTLTYAQLNERANQLAHQLQKDGVSHGECVAIFMPKSEYYVVAILAVLKAGGCYVPVDMDLPTQQIEFILQNAAARCVIIDEKVPGEMLPCLYVKQNRSMMPDSNPQAVIDGPAYIIYTSGSTGKPKGVRVKHSQLSHYCQAIQPVLNLPPDARYGMFSSFTTDLAHTVLFPALIHQGQLDVITTELLRSPQELFAYLAHYPVDCIKITPSHLATLLTSSQAEALLPHSLLIIGGERVPLSLITRVREFRSPCRILNHYGPTECTVGVTTYPVPDDLSAFSGDYLPIGKPLSDSHVLLLDPYQKLVPNGLPGEIYLGGSHVAEGYIGLPEQNDARFIPHPYLEGERLYRSGDKGRFLPDGNLEFMGRLDRQVKVRGYRVELAEIEQALQQVANATHVAIKQNTLPHGDAVLTAYLCGITEPNQAAVKIALHNKLPDYMHPERWVWLDAMPLTASGKINYAALPIPSMEKNVSFHAPENQHEHDLHEIYRDILQNDTVDTQESFFTLGGNSLSALKLILSVNQHFGTSLSLGQLFENSSISQLARVIGEKGSQTQTARVTINVGQPEDKSTLLLIHPAGGNVLCYSALARELGGSYPIYGIQVPDFSVNQPYNADIKTLAAFYLSQAGDVIHHSRLVLGGWSLGATIAFEMAQQLAEKGIKPTVLVLDQPAPEINIDGSADMNEAERLSYFAQKVALFTGASFDLSEQSLSDISNEQRTARFLAEFKRVGLVPESIGLAEFQDFINILQAHIYATEAYRGQPYPGDVLVVEAEDILPGRTRLPESGLGWRRLTAGCLTVLPASGDHISMMNAPHISRIAEQLKNVLR
ncbi:non-ribosomal peptide synthetase [Pectobacterium peruviense]|uniref:Non-ribosomal peptide synthetase n=1 Tax=Pectobacterium peruviense TaxID=2066479 RepID=A0ABX4SC39_9GAMM|nr:non-ribosomal peptide synthetase [Pectobacterium peruviense]KML70141.1 thioester reductase [Pectobacterium peruviense]PKX82905.1 non-ribosomal peptide synthetase [Pectobacterium peruviense]PKX86915.1 non-ribosomal peptide synthetase [Pectobacterium peruviense]